MKIARLGTHLTVISVVMALLLMSVVPAPALAQPVTSPLMGSVLLNGEDAPDGTPVRVLVGDETQPRQTGETATITNQQYQYYINLVGGSGDVGETLTYQVFDGTDWLVAATDPADPQFAGAGPYNPQVFDLTAPGADVTVTTESANPIATTSATLRGNLGDGILDGSFSGIIGSVGLKFQWGTSDSYGNETVATPSSMASPGGTFSTNISDLDPGTTYRFRASATATTVNGEVTIYGGDQSFTTVTQAPTVTTNAATDVTATTAILHGEVTNFGGANIDSVNVYFEWGTTTQYGNLTPMGTPTEPGAFQYELVGLNPGTTYHFRAVAAGDSTGTGLDRDFLTGTLPPTVTTLGVSGISGTATILNGVLDKLGGEANATVWLEWSTTSGGSYTETTQTNKASTGRVSAALTELTARTTN